tara:strand:- start:896 stop:1054 length:159 start_codon:yes stop_codon:yes gene_type:complete
MYLVDLELDLVVFLNRRKENNQLDFQEKGIKLIDLKGKNNINNELYGFYNPF